MDDQRRRWVLPTILVPVVLLVIVVIAWAVDTSSAGVARNVHLGGVDISHLSEAELSSRVSSLADRLAKAPVQIVAEPGDEGREGEAAR
jgi:hypothetical protein